MACESLRAKGTRDAEILAILQLMGAAGSLDVAPPGHGRPRRQDTDGVGDQRRSRPHAPNCSRTSATDVRTVLPPVLSIRNGRRSVVITGTPEQLGRFELYCSKITEREEAERKNKLRGGAVFSPEFHGIQVEVGFHTPRLADGRRSQSTSWAARTGHRRRARP